MSAPGLHIASKTIKKKRPKREKTTGNKTPVFLSDVGVTLRGRSLSQISRAAHSQERRHPRRHCLESRSQKHGCRARDWSRNWKPDDSPLRESQESDRHRSR